MNFEIQKAKGGPADDTPVSWAVERCGSATMEPKYDGWRVVFIVDIDPETITIDPETGEETGEKRVRVFGGRNHKEYTGQIPEIEAEIAKLPVGTILDGELVAMSFDGERWVQNFKTVQTAMASDREGRKMIEQEFARKTLRYVAFDMIRCNDEDISGRPHAERRLMMACLFEEFNVDKRWISVTIQMVAMQESHDGLIALGFEGSIVRDSDAPYAFGKKGYGLFKFKGTTTIDCIVMKLPIDGKGRNEGLVGKMAMGQILDADGEPHLTHRCKVNAPNDKERAEMTHHPERYLGRVAEIKVYGYDPDTGNPRHPTFLRWREDKPAVECCWSES